jgi:hypothetical protein
VMRCAFGSEVPIAEPGKHEKSCNVLTAGTGGVPSVVEGVRYVYIVPFMRMGRFAPLIGIRLWATWLAHTISGPKAAAFAELDQ